MNIVITGVAGLVGANFCEYILNNKHSLGVDNVFGVDDLSGGYIENLPLDNIHFQFIKADLTNKDDQKLIENVFQQNKITYIFHYSAYAAEG